MGIGSDLINSVLGNTEHAIITIEDKRGIMTKPKSGKNTAALSQSMLLGAAGSALSAAASMSSLVSAAVSAASALTGLDLTGTSGKMLKVQFNPNELSLSAKGGGKAKKLSLDGKDVAYSMEPENPRIDFSAKLIFDQVNVNDSFMGDNLSLNPTSLVSGAVSALIGKTYSVQTEVEGFIAAVRDSRTRSVTFQWGDFCFKGTLASVNAKYTMFSKSGKPVRAIVELSLISFQDKEAQQIFMEDFRNSFGGNSMSLVSNAQKVGNVFNLSK